MIRRTKISAKPSRRRILSHEHNDTVFLGMIRLLGVEGAREYVYQYRPRSRGGFGGEFQYAADLRRFYSGAAHFYVTRPELAEDVGMLSDEDAEAFAHRVACSANVHHHWATSEEALLEFFIRHAGGLRGTDAIRAAARFVVSQVEPGRERIRKIESRTASFDAATWLTGDM